MFGLHSIPVILVLCVLQFSQIQGHMNLHNNNNNRITKHSQNGNIQYKGDGLRNPLYLSSLDLSSTTTSLPSDNKNTKVGVLLLNLGGPETLEDVEGFLYNLFADPDIIRLPKALSILQKPIAKYISTTRSPNSMEGYKSIGGGSPIVKFTTEQARGIQTILRQRGLNASCYFAMRYWKPYTSEVLDAIESDFNGMGVDALVVLPLYPHYSVSTSGSSLRVLKEEIEKRADRWNSKIPITVVPAWYNRPGYINTMAKLIAKEFYKCNFNESQLAEGVHVLFSAHGVPQSYIASGDPYQRHIEDCVRLIVSRMDEALMTYNPNKTVSKGSWSFFGRTESPSLRNYSSALTYHLSYQSRVGPVEWLRPYTDDKIKELVKEQGVRNMLVVPIAFVSEHIETLEEIDMQYRELAIEEGLRVWGRVPALNSDEGFLTDMADLVQESLRNPIVSIDQALQVSMMPGKIDPESENMISKLSYNPATSVSKSLATAKYWNTVQKPLWFTTAFSFGLLAQSYFPSFLGSCSSNAAAMGNSQALKNISTVIGKRPCFKRLFPLTQTTYNVPQK